MTDTWAIFGPSVRGRRCGGCTLCCTLLPVRAIDKPASTPCRHLCSKGCRIYGHHPFDCRLFKCRWLMDETTGKMRRPDKVGYVVDPMLDTIFIDEQPVDRVQVWVDPARPDAHEDPALRAWLEDVARRPGFPALIRWNQSDGFVLFAPVLTASGEWEAKSSSETPISREEVERRRAEHAPPLRYVGS